MKNYHKQIMDTDGKIRSFMQETLASLMVIKVFKSEDKVEKTASELQEENFRRKAKRNIISLTTHCIKHHKKHRHYYHQNQPKRSKITYQ